VGILKDSICKSRELALAVIAIHLTVVIVLVVDAIVEATTLWAVVTILILSFNDEINSTIFGWESLIKLKNRHISISSCFIAQRYYYILTTYVT
jgi:hypothetical protein